MDYISSNFKYRLTQFDSPVQSDLSRPFIISRLLVIPDESKTNESTPQQTFNFDSKGLVAEARTWDITGFVFTPGLPLNASKDTTKLLETDVLYINPHSLNVRTDHCIFAFATPFGPDQEPLMVITGTRSDPDSKTPYMDDALQLFYMDQSDEPYEMFANCSRGYIRHVSETGYHYIEGSLVMIPSSKKIKQFEKHIGQLIPESSDIIIDPFADIDNELIERTSGHTFLPGFGLVDGSVKLIFRPTEHSVYPNKDTNTETILQLINAIRADCTV